MRTTTDGQELPHFETIAAILVRRGLASSAREAGELVRAGNVLVAKRDDLVSEAGYFPMRLTTVTDPKERFRYNEPVKVSKAKYGSRKKKATRRQATLTRLSELYPITAYDIRFLRGCCIAIEPIR